MFNVFADHLVKEMDEWLFKKIRSEFRVLMSVAISEYKRCSVRLYLQLFVGGRMSYLRYLSLFMHNGVKHILLFFVLCTLCCQFICIFLFWLPLRYSLTFIYKVYSADLREDQHLFGREVPRWRARWAITEDRSSKLANTLARTNKCIYPAIHIILTVLITMPTSYATSESAFSTKKGIKKT